MLITQISGSNLKYCTEMKFSVSEVAKYMGKKFDEVYSELRRLKSYGQETVEQKENEIASAVLVELSGRIFSVQSSRDFSQEKRHNILAYLQKKMKSQEECEVEKLHLLHAVLQSATRYDSTISAWISKYFICSLSLYNSHSERHLTIENLVDQYFSKRGLNIAYLRDHKIRVMPLEFRMSSEEQEIIEKDIQEFLSLYKHSDCSFTATAIARIFYGIGSPLFPYDTWKEQSLFWWKYIRKDFNKLRDIATSKLP